MNSLWSKCELATTSLSCDLVRTRLADCRYSIATFSCGVDMAAKGSTFPKLLMSRVRDTLDPRLTLEKNVIRFKDHMNDFDDTNLSFCTDTQFSENFYRNKDQMSFSLMVPELTLATTHS